MKKFTNPLENLYIASPCSADWNSMTGSEQKRFCADCKLNVYNLSEMTKQEAEDLINKTEGRLCARIYRRADGTIITKDCPVGWAKVKQKVSKRIAAFASVIFGLTGSLGFQSLFAADANSGQNLQRDNKNLNSNKNRKAKSKTKSKTKDKPAGSRQMGRPLMGDIAPLAGIVAIKEKP